MAENRLKIHFRRMIRSPLTSCKSKDQIADVVESQNKTQPYQLVELFTYSPMEEQRHFITKEINNSLRSKLPFLSPDAQTGRKCPPASPIISPLNNFPKKSTQKPKKLWGRSRKKSLFEDEFPECKYNGLFSSDVQDGNDSTTSSQRRKEAETAVEDTLAVVKRSCDPYTDFRTSMVEMIVEKQIFAAKDLENLLQCFLSLNSYHHHKIIIQVFAEIRDALLL